MKLTTLHVPPVPRRRSSSPAVMVTRRILSVAAASVAMMLFVGSPAIAAVKSLAVEAETPSDGATIAPTSTLALSLDSAQAAALWSGPYSPSLMLGELATAPTLGQDGTLAREFTVSSATLTRGDAFPNRFSGTAYTYPALAPGTYYWQANFTKVEDAPAPTYSEINTYASPVFRFVIAAPAAPPVPPRQDPASSPGTSPAPSTYFSLRSAKATARAIIRDQTGHRAYHLKQRCRRQSRSKFTCTLTWLTTSALRPGTWIYSGTLRMQDIGNDVLYSFRGLRAKESCLRRNSVQHCARTVRW